MNTTIDPQTEPTGPSRPWVELPARLSGRVRFLNPDAATPRLIRATALNHISWFTAGSLAGGGEIRREGPVTWLASPAECVIAFPRLSGAMASAVLDAILADCRQRKPQRVACWALTPTQPRDLGVRLAARGFEWGWQPHLMALDLHTMRADIPAPDNLTMALDDESEWDVADLPYYSRQEGAVWRTTVRAQPRRTWHFGAWSGKRLVGHTALHVTTGALGVAGIYAVGVVPSARKQGIGRALALAACQFARALGCHYATLNAATDLYSRLGFRSLGWGQTWWMHTTALTAPIPTKDQIAFAEAVGRGDVKALAALDPKAILGDLDEPLLCGMTPIAMAVKARKPASVTWLVDQGATLEILAAWDLGWKDRVPGFMERFPDRVNRRRGPLRLTPLHEAAERGDVELARLLLASHPDLQVRDAQFKGTPLDWARHFGRAEIVALIEQATQAPMEAGG